MKIISIYCIFLSGTFSLQLIDYNKYRCGDNGIIVVDEISLLKTDCIQFTNLSDAEHIIHPIGLNTLQEEQTITGLLTNLDNLTADFIAMGLHPLLPYVCDHQTVVNYDTRDPISCNTSTCDSLDEHKKCFHSCAHTELNKLAQTTEAKWSMHCFHVSTKSFEACPDDRNQIAIANRPSTWDVTTADGSSYNNKHFDRADLLDMIPHGCLTNVPSSDATKVKPLFSIFN